ncbi:MAG TPA: hypothetical protein VF466_01915 [Candidatus Saccharimonadales bacterium]
MTEMTVRPPFEDSLHHLWLHSQLELPPQFAKPVSFNAGALIGVLLGHRRRWHLDVDRYLSAMGQITGATATSPEEYRRRIAFAGQTLSLEQGPPQLIVGLARDERERIVDCSVAIAPSVPHDAAAPEYMLARVPVALLVADADGLLTADFRTDARMPELQNLAVAAGAVLLDGAMGQGFPA